MKVLIENSAYVLCNMGDLAMLRAAIERLHARWPEAILKVVTSDPEGVRALSAAATPLVQGPVRFPRIQYALMRRLKERGIATSLLEHWGRLHRRPVVRNRADADLVIATGGGFINDSFSDHALGVLATLESAIARGRPAVLVGQGIGPVTDPRLLASMKKILPRADLIVLREGRHSPGILESVGVSRGRILVSGDDAIESAYRERPEQLGSGIGVNIRKASYSGVDDGMLPRLGQALRELGRAKSAAFEPVPIHKDDLQGIRSMLGEAGATLSAPTSLAGLVAAVARCRIVVTGSYHAAVFALSQGVPALGITASKYYDYKFDGLAHQFGEGFTSVNLAGPDPSSRFERAASLAWENAPKLRGELLERAADQVARGKQAYERIFELVERRLA